MSKTTDYSTCNKQLKQQLKNQEMHLQNLQSQLDQVQSAKAYQIWQKIALLKRGSLKIIKNPSKLPKALSLLLKQGPSALAEKAVSIVNTDQFLQNINAQYQIWFKNHYPSAQELADQSQKSKGFKHQPLISIITPTYNTPIQYLRECIESVIDQSYPNWELCLADDWSTDQEVRKVINDYAQKDKRIKYTFRKTNGHISSASNSALKLATGEWIGLLDHDDVLWPNALYEVAKHINNNPDSDFIYSDEDKLSEDGITHCDPFFKPDWSPDLLIRCNYIAHFMLARTSLIKTLKLDKSYDGAQDWHLALKISQTHKPSHINKIIYSWRKHSTSTASPRGYKSSSKLSVLDSQKRLLSDTEWFNQSLSPSESSYTGLWQYSNPDRYHVIINGSSSQVLDSLQALCHAYNIKSDGNVYEIVTV